MSPNISEDDINAVADVLRSGMLVQGENVEALESSIAEYVGVEHAVAVSNGTATLHISLVALGVGPGDEVIIPAFSYVATANVVEIVGAECVFVDIEPDTFNIDLSKVEAAVTSRTKAIMPVHEFGLACDIDPLVELATKHGLPVVEDAACALGATEKSKQVGSFGTVGSFSLHPRKSVTSGEGGILTTKDDNLADSFRLLRNHGMLTKDGSMDCVLPGFNYRMTDFQAALVRGQFAELDRKISHRRMLAKAYFEKLGDIVGLTLPALPEGKDHTWQTFHVVLDDGINRDMVIAGLRKEGIGTNLGAQCIPAQTFYRETYGKDCNEQFPNAMRAYEQGLALPLFDKIGTEEVDRVTESLRRVIAS
ncbi:MAG: DegT/DnrJ/EryC1/StrS family aminotransferase [Rhodothermales bacterium]|nr:DegT/DnrJ/EryC1/StrS family aminotransferase [Rhodothermales bacterium]NNE56445.1 DegT/DnrJ/EryC1/StrS family aminotransferase [Flavobacteriales bacterium]